MAFSFSPPKFDSRQMGQALLETGAGFGQSFAEGPMQQFNRLQILNQIKQQQQDRQWMRDFQLQQQEQMKMEAASMDAQRKYWDAQNRLIEQGTGVTRNGSKIGQKSSPTMRNARKASFGGGASPASEDWRERWRRESYPVPFVSATPISSEATDVLPSVRGQELQPTYRWDESGQLVRSKITGELLPDPYAAPRPGASFRAYNPWSDINNYPFGRLLNSARAFAFDRMMGLQGR